MWWLVGVVAVVVAVATYLTWIAARVDRLHHRAEAAYAALDARLTRRAAAAVTLAEVDPSLGDRAVLLRDVARQALRPASDGREITENQLTRVVRELTMQRRVPVPEPAPAGGATADPATQAAAELVNASRRVALARQVHTDLVRETLAARRRPVVRVLGLDRRHRRPAYFDIEDPVIDG
ncbi:MAG: hypothetical protein ACRDUA_04865 [Micromonosporaceae bacterium]